MHSSFVAPDLLDRVSAMCGGRPEIALDPARTAHLIVDLQVGFMAPGAVSEIPVARELVANVNRLSQAVRAAGGVNVFLRFTVDLDEPLRWASLHDRVSPQTRDMLAAAFARGTEQHRLWPDLDVRPEDLVLDKTRYSGFIPGACDLHAELQARGVEAVIVTGTLSNCCCESTARDAMQYGYRVLFVADGAATSDDGAHNATLANMAGLLFAEVVTTDEAVARLGQGARAAA